MRPRIPRLLAVAVAAALTAAACSDAPDLGSALDGPAPSSTEADAGTTDTRAPDADPLVIPDAPTPDPDPTPLPVDDDVRIGTLDNGLTYLIRSNDTPGASLDLRLVVDAGSLQQEVGDDGSAHVLEHMLFNGTERFPGNELTRRLQQLGISFGADVNAFTSHDETVYLLGATTFDSGAVATAFDVLAEWASAATIAEDDVAAEIGVVRDELRQGVETVDGFIETRFEETYTEGTAYEGHPVIGTAEKVEALDADTLRRFYDTWYRPDNMAVVVVGDLPLDEIETAIVDRFAPLEARAADRPERADITVPLDAGPRAEVLVVPDNPADFLSLDMQLPVWDLGTVGGERMALIEEAVASIISTRLEEAYQRGDLETDGPGFLTPFEFTRGLRYYGTNFQSPDLGAALEQYLGQLRASAVEGFTDDDVERARSILLADLDEQARSAGSTQDFEYATELMLHALQGAGIDDAQRRIDRQREVVESLTAEELTDFWRWLLRHSGPIIVQVVEDATDQPDTDELLAIVERARPAGSAEATGTIDALMTPPAPAGVVDERVRRTAAGPVTEWTFDNGVVVSHEQTDVTEGSFDVWLRSSGGWSTFDDVGDGVATIATDAVLSSGVGPYDRATLRRYLESHDVSLSAEITDYEERMDARAATDDATDLFQLIHLTATEPRVDDTAFRSAIRAAENFAQVVESDADVRQSRLAIELLTDGEPRYDQLVPDAVLDQLDPDRLLGIFADRFGTVDDLHVAIVGDIERDDARDLAARYLGTLPSGPADTWREVASLPTETRSGEVELVDDTANGGIMVIDWVLAPPDADTDVAAVLLSTIVTNRITDVIREDLGASYGGFASIELQRTGPTGYVSFVQVDGDPERLDEIRDALFTILAELAADGPTAEEFDRAEAVQEDDYQFIDDALFLSTNIARTRFPDQDVLEPDDRLRVLAATDATDVQALAAALYGDPVWVEVSKVLK